MPKKPEIKQESRNVITLRFDEIAAGWEYWVLLMSDNHHDSPYCRRKLERRHLEMARDRGGLVMIFGDVFDVMQGKFDPRRSLDDVRPEDKVSNYLDSIVDHASQDYGEFADNIALISKGNHESTVLDKTNTCLISRLVDKLNHATTNGHHVYTGGYGGWVKFMFTSNGTRRNSYSMKYHHGSGGGAPVTRGVIHTNRQSVFLPDADIVVNGHNHQAYVLPIARERLTRHNKVITDLCWHIRTPGYKNEWGDGSGGYAVEKNQGPTPTGAVWLKFYYDDIVKVKPIPEIE